MVLRIPCASCQRVGYFLFQQHLNETKFFAELFEKFNTRYGKLNRDLQKLLKSDKEFEGDDTLIVIDYFHLCAEEHLFCVAGYIVEGVWHACVSGIQRYAVDKRSAGIWAEKGRGKSYFGFDFTKVLQQG